MSDGTPILADDNGDVNHVDIRTTTGGRHPAFPTGKNKGSARRKYGLVISNHFYGEFIVRLEQTRENERCIWTTISTSGPIEPLPAPPKIEVHYQYASYGYVTASMWPTEANARLQRPTDGVVKVTRTDGKVTNVEFLP